MNLSRVKTEALIQEIANRASGVSDYDPIPVDSTKNHLVLERNERGQFVKRV